MFDKDKVRFHSAADYPLVGPNFGPHTTWGEFSNYCFQAAFQKGWWPAEDLLDISDDSKNIYFEIRQEKMLLIESEKIEAFEAARNGDPLNVWYTTAPSLKPEGVQSELADVVIRIADWTGAEAASRPESFWDESAAAMIGGFDPETMPENYRITTIREFANHISRSGASIGPDGHLQDVRRIFLLAAQCGADLWPAINAKLAYNATRPARHGGKLA